MRGRRGNRERDERKKGEQRESCGRILWNLSERASDVCPTSSFHFLFLQKNTTPVLLKKKKHNNTSLFFFFFFFKPSCCCCFSTATS